MDRRAFGVALLGAAAAVTGCGQSSSQCAVEYRRDYQSKHGIPPTEQQVRDACSTNNRRRGYYGSGSRGSTRGGGTSSGK